MTETQKRWHRFRHYPGRWSTFDQIEECERPGKFCCGCEFEHPFCSNLGKVLDGPSVSNGERQ
jgi:hypothetical protein